MPWVTLHFNTGLRYIDDILMIWTESSEKLKIFIHYLNNIHPTIFTSTDSSTNVPFLDVNVSLTSNGDIYKHRLIYKTYGETPTFTLFILSSPSHKKSYPFQSCTSTSTNLLHAPTHLKLVLMSSFRCSKNCTTCLYICHGLTNHRRNMLHQLIHNLRNQKPCLHDTVQPLQPAIYRRNQTTSKRQI